jgi:exosortase A
MNQNAVRSSLWAAGLFCLALLFIYHETVLSIVYIWSRSETFAHGFLILPISLWLVWLRRDLLASVRPEPAWRVGLLVIPIQLGWLLAWLVDVAVIQQLALVAMMVVGAWAVMGHRLARVLAFPLFFLFFAVPMGEGLIAPMMDFTASSTVWLIELTGIPVYREGLNFALPTGNWSVVEACSGVRYIIASVTVGVLYAYLTYRSWTRRLIFVVISAIVPIFANTVRAYMIVMLGHLSDMTIATGADHLIYGWVFFGMVIFLLFWLGAFFREHDPGPAVAEQASTVTLDAPPSPVWKLAATVSGTLLIASLAPALAYTSLDNAATAVRTAIALPPAKGTWHSAGLPRWHWTPPSRVSGQQYAYYERDGHTLGLIVQFADGTIAGADVIGSSAQFAPYSSTWFVVRGDRLEVQGPEGNLGVDEAQLRSANGELLAWSWYRMGDVSTSNDYEAKLLQTMARLGLENSGAYRVIVVTPVQASYKDTRALLQEFVLNRIPALYEDLRQPEMKPQ